MPDDAGFTLEDARARLLIRESDLPRTARDLAELLAGNGEYFNRGGPVCLIQDAMSGGLVAKPLTKERVVHAAHASAQPIGERIRKGRAEEVPVTLPDRVALLYLHLPPDQWRLPPLHGIAYAPILSTGGSIRSDAGYDAPTCQWCEGVPNLHPLVPKAPTRKQASAALLKLRQTFKTFPFADAPRCRTFAGLEVVDTSKPPGMDESGLLVGLLTAICRPSLELAPGLLVRAPSINGSGTGKGLLVRAICAIAYCRSPAAFTGGNDIKELEKQVGAAMMEAAPAVFLDNLNGIALESNLLASVLTERVAAVRILGRSEMVRLNAATFMIVTGNGLSLAEDLVRRFLVVELDARTEDPESRRFTGNLLADVQAHRVELLAAGVTIWRWAQLNARKLTRGAPLGGYDQWAGWVRDALLSLGTADPATRIAEVKATDARRQDTALIFQTWHERHGERPMLAKDLHPDVRELIDPHNRGRQHLVAALLRLEGTRIAGLTLSRCKSDAAWSKATYAVLPVLPLA
jgi:hypothetical protein